MAKETVYVIGHKSPDTDTVCSSLAYAEYLAKKEKLDAIPAVCGELNPETKFILKTFAIKAPKKLESASGKTLILMDHNENSQMPDGAQNAKILEVVDHHKINFEYHEPIKFRAEPLGSTATIVAKIMLANKFKISKQTAGILLSAILSDTVVFKSPTATPEDQKIAKLLAKTAKIKDIKKFGIEIKKQKASLKGLSAQQIINSDYKTFESNNKKFAVGQIEVVDLSEAKTRANEIMAEMEKMRSANNLEFIALMATDIINCGSLVMAAGNCSYIEKAFGKTCAAGSCYIDGMMSRKKDMLPPLLKTLE
jgi:manganese-dependent inorganic pyrophosphatase